MELARKLGWAGVSSGVLLLVAAICSQATGTDLATSTGAEVNSHATSTWVLGAFGFVFLIHAGVLIAWANEQLWTTRRQGKSTRPTT